MFALRFNAGFNLIDTKFFCNGARRALIVASEHDHFDSKPMQMINRCMCRFFYRIGDGENAGDAPIDGNEDRRLSLRLKIGGFRFEFVEIANVLRLEKLRLAHEYGSPVHLPTDAAACA